MFLKARILPSSTLFSQQETSSFRIFSAPFSLFFSPCGLLQIVKAVNVASLTKISTVEEDKASLCALV